MGDRLPLAAMIVLIYFGVMRSHRVLGLTMMVVLAALVVLTAPNRWGVSIALHYLSRVYWPDLADPIPPPPATRLAVKPSAEGTRAYDRDGCVVALFACRRICG